MTRPSRPAALAAWLAAIVLIGIAIVLVYVVPVEAVLGTRVRLPLFHGASTWVGMAVFAIMGLLAAAYLITAAVGKPRLGLYAWEAGFRTVGAPLWVFNSLAGLMAALKTWDFTGSKESPISMALQDPRLMATFWILLALGALIGLETVLDKPVQKAWADLGFTLLTAILLGDVLLDPVKRSLHPDNPVLNSAWNIKGPFFGIVAALFAAAVILAWLASGYAKAAETSRHVEEHALQEA